jgi:hypothetical protein
MTSFVQRTTWVRPAFLCAGLLASLCGGFAALAQRTVDEAGQQRLYLVAATLTVKGRPGDYPVTLYQATQGKLKFVRDIIPSGPQGDTASEGSMAPTSLCCVPVSRSALYFLYPYYRSTTVSIVHFDDPTRVDDVTFNSKAGWTDGMRTAVVPRSPSEDELLIPIILDFSDPSHLKGTLTNISSATKASRVTSDADVWNDYANLQREGDVGGPGPQTALVGVRAGDNIAVSVLDHAVVVDALPPELREVREKKIPIILAANERYLLSVAQLTSEEMASGKLGDTVRIFSHDRAHGQWNAIQIEGNAPRLRLFGPWLAAIVMSWNPAHAPNPGRESERSEGTDRLPNIQSLYAAGSGFGRYSIPGILTLQNLADDRKIRIVTGQEDSEILNVKGDAVFYRVNNTIYKALIAGNKLKDSSVLVNDEDVAEVHWVFWSK